MQASRLRGMTPDAAVIGTHGAASRSPSAKWRHLLLRLFAVVALLCVGRLVHASPIVYTLNPLVGINGSVLTGTITVDDADNNGAIVASEIVAWSFTSTGGVSFSFSSATAGAGSQCLGTPGGFSATPTTLSFNFGSVVPNDPFANFFVPGAVVQLEETAQGGPDPVNWSTGIVSDRGHWPTDVIATAPGPVGVRAQTWTDIKLLYR
jgi:hypothetical protein